MLVSQVGTGDVVASPRLVLVVETERDDVDEDIVLSFFMTRRVILSINSLTLVIT